MPTPLDDACLAMVLEPIKICQRYKPKFGLGAGAGLSLAQFQQLYGNDLFYEWFGLDNPLMYAAHKAAGGMTSVYRQIGIGCERLFRHIIQQTLDLQAADVIWSYEIAGAYNKTRTLSLDARIPTSQLVAEAATQRFQFWLNDAAKAAGVATSVIEALSGAVFEVRQGYKSKDAKRQNGDISNAATAYASGYLPCLAVLSGQIDIGVASRYRSAKWTVLTGTIGLNDPLLSTYDFMRDVVGYDLAGFFQRNKAILREEINHVLQVLLTPDAT